MRVLITGSRDWTDQWIIFDALEKYSEGVKEHITLVSGACPTGADKICEQYGIIHDWDVETHPAQWLKAGKYDPTAGYVRNAEMVKLGADICLAFIKNNSKGATMTAKLADKAGIRTIIFRPNSEV